MGKSKSSAPVYPKSTTDTTLFGSSTTSRKGGTFSPTTFQKQLVGVTEKNAAKALNNYLNPNYESEDYKRGDEYYTEKMQNVLQNNYLNPALSRNLLRGSTASDAMRGFANDLANSEYERQQDYRNQQLQNYQAAMLPYTTIYDMMTGTQGLSNSLNNSIANYNLQAYQADQANKQNSGFGSLLGSLGNVASIAKNGATAAATIAPLLSSDKRLKENIEKLDEVEGINIYKFDFIEGAKNQVGVIAQEIEKTIPEAVVEQEGYLKVDYSKLPQAVQNRIEELKNGK